MGMPKGDDHSSILLYKTRRRFIKGDDKMGIPLSDWNVSPYRPQYFEIDNTLYRLTQDPFEYSWEWVPLAASSTGTPVITNILSDSDFVAVVGVASIFANDAARAAIQNHDVTIAITDQGSGRFISDKPVSLRHWFGEPNNPFVLTPPKLFTANSSVQITAINNSNVAVVIRATFAGYKAYKLGVDPEKAKQILARAR